LDSNFSNILRQEEESPDLWKPLQKEDHYPIWPLIRFEVITHILYKQKSLQIAEPGRRHAGLWKKAFLRFQARRLHPLRSISPGKAVVFFTKGKSLRRDPKGRWLHPQADRLIRINPSESILIEKSHNKTIQTKGRPCRFLSYEGLDLEAHKCSRNDRKSKSLERLSREYVRKVENSFCMPMGGAFLDELKNTVQKICAKTREYDRLNRELFENLRPQMAIFEDAHYGDMMPLVRAANQAGVLTAEIQHGILDANHPAYNMAEGTRQRLNHAELLPTHFLVWGKYWAEKVHPSISTILVGREVEQHNSSRTKSSSGGRCLLVISSGCSVQILNSILPRLASELVPLGWKIRLRPHPVERNEVGRLFPAVGQILGLELDPRLFVGESLREVDCVLGDFSTVLYEAAAMNLPVILLKNEGSKMYSDQRLGSWAQDADEVCRLIIAGLKPGIGIQATELEDPLGLENFQKFLNQTIGAES